MKGESVTEWGSKVKYKGSEVKVKNTRVQYISILVLAKFSREEICCPRHIIWWQLSVIQMHDGFFNAHEIDCRVKGEGAQRLT